jgi:hypothetical protein
MMLISLSFQLQALPGQVKKHEQSLEGAEHEGGELLRCDDVMI